MTTFDVFAKAERIELVAAAIYAAAAKQLREDEPSRALFVRLEAEELQHAARIRLLAARYRADPRLLGSVASAGHLDACLAAAERALADLTGGRWGQDVAGVRARLVLLEGELSSAHAHVIAEDGHPALREFFQQLAAGDAAHAALLGP